MEGPIGDDELRAKPTFVLERILQVGFYVLLVGTVVGVGALFQDVGKEGRHAVEVLSGEGVEFVIVTLGAGHGRSQPCGSGGAYALGLVLLNVFLILDTAFATDLVEAIVAGGDLLFNGGVGQKVAGDLLDGEGVVRLVLIKGLDDVVAVGGGVAFLIAMVTHSVGVANGIEPGNGHAFPIVGRSQQAINKALVGVR